MTREVRIFHIIEDVIDDHIEAFKQGKIIDGCYLTKSIDDATKKLLIMIDKGN